ncbi:MAG: tRNA (adenosine(37)-N6)-threonylcarbamoyltransferase complex ATPase subunit type 1 TsaE [Bacteroidota bacterium]
MNTTYKLQMTDIECVARQFVEEQSDGRVFAFYGQMGAGKTTFIAAVCKALGIEEPVNSPTFAIVNEYVADNGETVYHFDCYRLNTLRDALNIGIEEYFASGNICFIEWAENIEELLPVDTVRVNIVVEDDGSREVSVCK